MRPKVDLLQTLPATSYSSRAFTLIEVLVVVAIMALLVSILIPSLSAARDQANRSLCATNLHQQNLGMRSYAQDYRGYLPYRGWFSYDISEVPREAYGTGGRKTKVLVNIAMLMGKHLGHSSKPRPGKKPGKEWDILYCPTTSRQYQKSPSGLPSVWDPSYDFTFGGYNYALPMAARSGAPRLDGDVYPRDLKKLDGGSSGHGRWIGLLEKKAGGAGADLTRVMPKGTQPLVMDAVVGGFAPPHGATGVNVAHSDGHVRFVNTKRLTGLSSGADKAFELWWYVTFHP